MAKKRKTTSITKDERIALYAAAKYLPLSVEKKVHLKLPFAVYLQDPFVAKRNSEIAFDDALHVDWEPGLSDGPTSARFAVVDYNAETRKLTPPAKWDRDNDVFVDSNGTPLGTTASADVKHLQSHQVNVWVTLQRALDYFEDSFSLGRRIPWGFSGNRLHVVPHAGYGQNAYYDRQSKSLQFYYFKNDDKDVFTCLSPDIINHEFGHAILDGIRPYYIESTSVQTRAFHEFIGDLTSILLLLNNNKFRAALAEQTAGNLRRSNALANLAEEFGSSVSPNPYLRSANNRLKMSKTSDDDGAHHVSQVMTGAMFDILVILSKEYSKRGHSWKASLNYAQRKFRVLSTQSLDLLPPVDVSFKDYAMAVLRVCKLEDPIDPNRMYDRLVDVFRRREILSMDEADELKQSTYLHETFKLDVYHPIESISESYASAYRFLDDNREKLHIPLDRDVIVADLYKSQKRSTDSRRLPKMTVLEYIWKEEVLLDDAAYGTFNGKITELLCGATLVFDSSGTVLYWSHKPGSPDEKSGTDRKEEFVSHLKAAMTDGLVGELPFNGLGFIDGKVPPIISSVKEDGTVQFRISPHLNAKNEDHYKGERQWQISS